MTSGSLKEITSLMARYNLWANTVLTDYVGSADPVLLDQQIPASFSTIGKTIKHILDAQEIWLLRLKGQSLPGFPGESELTRIDALLSALIRSSETYVSLEAAYTLENMQEEVSYRTFAGISQSSRRYEILTHVFNHSMYHRGQCITMARIAGLENPPSTDLIRFLRL